MEDAMAAIRETFFQECDEQLAELEAGLIALQNGTAAQETVNAVFRAVHSIKGGAGIFALDGLVRFAHAYETALDKLRAGTLAATPALLGGFLRAADMLADLVQAARENGGVDEARIAAMMAEFDQIDDDGAAPLAPEMPAAAWDISFTPLPALYAKANETVILLRELRRLGPLELRLDTSRLPDLAALDPEGAYLTWQIRLRSTCGEAAIRHVFEFAEDDCELLITPHGPQCFAPGTVITGENGFRFEFFAPADEDEEEAEPAPAPGPAAARLAPQPAAREMQGPAAPRSQAVEVMAAKAEAAGAVTATIRVDLDRVDRMIDLVGELVINEAMLSQRVLEAGLARAASVAMALEELEHLTREIQDSVMAIRAQPVRAVFQRMPRLVRELAAQTGKKVRLVMEGEGTEVDKTVIERIADPLTHMIRNAIDHGLESAAKRLEAGKPEEGTVRLAALDGLVQVGDGLIE